MLKTYADIYKLEGESVSGKSIGLIKALLVASFPAVPMLVIGEFFGIPDAFPVAAYIVIAAASFLALISLIFLRLPNRLYARDKYLDEWELDVKRRSMTFAYQFLVWGLTAVLTLGILIDGTVGLSVLGLTGAAALVPFLMLFVLAYYLQQLHALSLITPYEEDDDASEPPRSNMVLFGGALVTLAVIFSLMPAAAKGAKVASIAEKAVAECEAKGSSVAWVNTDKNPAFGCEGDG